MSLKNIVVALAVVVGVLAGFYGGYKVGQVNVTASTSTSSNQRAAGNFANGRGLGAVCPSPGATPSPGTQALARGTITNLSSTAMTVSNGQCDVTVTFGPTTTVQKQVAGSTSDLADNQTVTVTGTREADGSVKASAIQVGGAGGFRTPGAGTNNSTTGG